jgi:hypothetical protein
MDQDLKRTAAEASYLEKTIIFSICFYVVLKVVSLKERFTMEQSPS